MICDRCRAEHDHETVVTITPWSKRSSKNPHDQMRISICQSCADRVRSTIEPIRIRGATAEQVLQIYREEIQSCLEEGEAPPCPVKYRTAERLGITERSLYARIAVLDLTERMAEIEAELGWDSWGPGRPKRRDM